MGGVFFLMPLCLMFLCSSSFCETHCEKLAFLLCTMSTHRVPSVRHRKFCTKVQYNCYTYHFVEAVPLNFTPAGNAHRQSPRFEKQYFTIKKQYSVTMHRGSKNREEKIMCKQRNHDNKNVDESPAWNECS